MYVNVHVNIFLYANKNLGINKESLLIFHIS